MIENRLKVAITHGDTNGVGYEMIIKAFEDPTMLEICTPIIYGSSRIAEQHLRAIHSEVKFNIINDARLAREDRINLVECFNDEEVEVSFGTPTEASAKAALRSFTRAFDDYKQKLYDVLVTSPVNRSTINNFQGHSDYIERSLNTDSKSISILINESLRVALVTNNLAVKDISESITKQKIVEKGKLFFEALRRDLRVSSPRIAVMSLNPRCGEDGALGDEEKEIIKPAIDELVSMGINAYGPYATDVFFGRGDYYRFDGVMAMYHDQGMAPFKTLTPEDGVRLTSGLPIVRTAPAVGTQFQEAGKGIVSPDSLRHAIYMAIDVFNNRANYDEPLANPLPKLYHEKRDDSEKVRFRSSTNNQQ